GSRPARSPSSRPTLRRAGPGTRRRWPTAGRAGSSLGAPRWWCAASTGEATGGCSPLVGCRRVRAQVRDRSERQVDPVLAVLRVTLLVPLGLLVLQHLARRAQHRDQLLRRVR